MGVKRNLITGLMAFIFLAVILSPYALGASITACGSVGSGVHTIDNDISSTNNCINISNDTVIDGQGYTIYVNCSGFWSSESDIQNVSVSNLNIVKNGSCTGGSSAFSFANQTNMTYENITAYQTYYNESCADGGSCDWRFEFTSGCLVSGSLCENILFNNITINSSNYNAQFGFGWFDGLARNLTFNDITINGIYDLRFNFLIHNTETLRMSNIYANGSGNNIILALKNVSDAVINNTELVIGNYNDYVDSALELNTVSGAIIDGLTIDGNNQLTNYGIKDIFSHNVSINDFTIYNISRGILEYGATNITLTNGLIYNINTTSSVKGVGLTIWETNNTLAENISINNTATSALTVGGTSKPSENITITNVTSNYAGLCKIGGGISIFGTINMTVSESTFSGSPTGINMIDDVTHFNYIEDILLYNNTISNNTNNIILNITHTNIRFNDSAYGNSWDDYTGCDIQIDHIGDTPYTINATAGDYDYLPFTLSRCYPTITEFTGTETTNFTAEPDLANVTGMTLADSNVKITWSSPVDIASKDLDSAIAFANNSADVNLPALNSSATVVFKGVSYSDTDSFMVLKDGSNCTDCSILTASPVSFTVTGFSNYTTQAITTPAGDAITGMQVVANSILYLIPAILVIISILLVLTALQSGELDLKKLVIGAVILLIAVIFSGVIWNLI